MYVCIYTYKYKSINKNIYVYTHTRDGPPGRPEPRGRAHRGPR